MSVLTQLSVPEEARPLKIAPEAFYTSIFFLFLRKKQKEAREIWITLES